MIKISTNCVIRRYVKYLTLSSGKVAMFKLDFQWKENLVCYGIGACVAPSKKAARLWFSGKSSKLDNRITGDCNLEAFIFFKHCFEEVNALLETLNTAAMLCVEGADERRRSAYRYVKRYGYEEDIGVNGEKYYFKCFFKD